MDEIPDRIEHTVLGPTTTPDDVRACLDAAVRYGMRACVPPCYLSLAADYADVPLTTVVDFPHGQGQTDAVCQTAKQAWDSGADELDMVCNVGLLKAGDGDAVRDHIAEVVAAVPIPVKVIVEAPLLTDAELERVGRLAAEADATYLKTATGFSDGGATVDDVAILSRHLPVKASGGIGTWTEAKAMFDAGAERIGSSSGDAIVEEWLETRDGTHDADAGDTDTADGDADDGTNHDD